MEQENELGVKPVKKLLWKLAVPAITAQIVNVLYNVVDRIYIGHIPEVGKLALTGVGVCMPLIMLISAFAMLAGMGGAPRASIMLGRNDAEEAERRSKMSPEEIAEQNRRDLLAGKTVRA